MSEEKYNAGDEEHVKTAKRNQRSKKQYDEMCWDMVLNSPEGRYVINSILEMARPFAASFSLDNPRLTDFREGERNIGNKLIAHAFQGKRQALFTRMSDECIARNGRA